MQSLRDIKKRIRSVGNIEQITKAMEVVSMNKMRKSQSFALRARPYAVASLELMRNLLLMSAHIPPLLQTRPVKSKLLIVITADKGLVGSFNENVVRRAMQWIAEEEEAERPYSIIAIGKKAKDHFDRRGIPIDTSFFGFGDYTLLHETAPVAERIIGGFLSGAWDSAEAIYTHFRTTLRQETIHKKVLPVTEQGLQEVIEGIVPEYGRFHEIAKVPMEKTGIGRAAGAESLYNYEYLFEPGPEAILDVLLPSLIKVHVHHVILESNASEHSARMVSMKSASDNAHDLVDELTLSYNKARQAGITQELSEIIGGQASVE